MNYKLLEEFRKLFAGRIYRHRDSSQGDRVALYLYEDLFQLRRSPKFVKAVTSKLRVLNTQNLTVGQKSRRGDGAFGERLPQTDGKKYLHPFHEAEGVERDLVDRVQKNFDEFILLRFKAINKKPYAFDWVDQAKTENLYGAALVRISRDYESRF